MKTNSIWMVEPRKMEIRAIDVPDPKYDEVQIEIKACGVCAWDSYLYQGISAPGPLPYQIGHEGVGVVTKAGAGVTNIKPGDKVFCASGNNEMMASYTNLPWDCVAKIPDDVTDWTAWVAEPAVCVVNLLHLAGIRPGDHVVLVGAGYMGLLTLQGLRGTAAGSITAFELREDRRALAEAYLRGGVYDPAAPEGESKIEEIVATGGADVVIDFGASSSGYALACRLTRKHAGRLVLGSWHRHEESFDGSRWHLSGLSVLNLAPNSNAHFREMIPATAALIRRGIYDPGALVTHVADYRQADAVFRKSIDKSDGYVKGVITF